MASVDELINAIDNRDELTAQKLLEQHSPHSPPANRSETMSSEVQHHCIGQPTEI